MLSIELQRRVAQIDVLWEMVFPTSVAFWHCQGDSEKWSNVAPPAKPILMEAGEALQIDGDVSVQIDAPGGGVLHIAGDLLSDIEIGGHHEVVIGGSVAAGCSVRTSGFSKIYIRGSLHGEIHSVGSSHIWIDGEVTGSIKTGMPSTNLYIAGDLKGPIAPTNKAGLLWLTVDGYADSETMNTIAEHCFTQFHGFVRTSNIAAGLYPSGTGHRKKDGGNSYSRWCVLSQNCLRLSVDQ